MDVVIIGAGAAGLMSARILSGKGINVLVLEARDRLGGRIHTIKNSFTANCEAGAEFIHGNLKTTKKILKEAGLKQTKVKGATYNINHGNVKEEDDFVEGWDIVMHRLKKLETDIPIREFLDNYIAEEKYTGIKKSFTKYVQGYDAADINFASAFSIREEMENEDNVQYRVEGGYIHLINFLADESKENGCIIKTSVMVRQINWQKNNVEIITDGKIYKAKKVIVTVPIGVLQAAPNESPSIKFYPDITEHQKAIDNIGFGGVIKILLEFDEAFWFNKEFLKSMNRMDASEKSRDANIDKPFFFFADTIIPTWWTQFPDERPLLVGWLAGPDAAKYSDLNEDEFMRRTIFSLSQIFNIASDHLYKKLKTHEISNWVKDPFCKGGYSYATVATKKAVEVLKQPLQHTVYFAGEALAKKGMGTVDAALQSGEEVASEIIAE